MIVARSSVEETFDSLHLKNSKRRITVKQYQGTMSSERDPQGVTSAQPPEPTPKEAPNRRGEEQKKTKPSKPIK